MVARPAVVEILREHAYRRLWLSGLCLNAARWMDMVVLGWLALELTGSPFMVGLAAFARSAPMMVLGPLSGVIADRIHRGRVLLFTQALGASTGLALAALFASGRGGYWSLVSLELLFGAVWALDFPTRRTALYTLVGAGRVATAVSLETVSMQLAKMGGPVLAGVGLAHVGPAACYGGVAACYVAGLAISMRLGLLIGAAPGRKSASMAASLAAGCRAAWREPMLRAVLGITVLMNVLVFPYQQMLVVFAREVLRAGPEWLGGLVAAEGLGSLVGALAIASRGGFISDRRLFAIAVLAAPFLLLVFSGSHWRWACAIILLGMGAAESGFSTMQSTLVLLSAAEDRRGGAMGILSACIGTQPFGAFALGVLATAVGVAPAIALNSAIALALIAPVTTPLWRQPTSREA